MPNIDAQEFKPHWDKLNGLLAEQLETDVLKISLPRKKLDPIVEAKLVELRKKFKGNAASAAEMEKALRTLISSRGIASQVKKVTQRLNARQMTDGRRVALAATYMYLLSQMFGNQNKSRALKDLMSDDLGVAERIMLDLEAPNGPIEEFADLIVKSVADRNRLQESEVLTKRVSQQVRANI